jgi:hypothetical protein
MSELEAEKTIDIEEIVPVVMNAEEKTALVTVANKELKVKTLRIEELLETEQDEAVREKVLVGQDLIRGLSDNMASAKDSMLAFETYFTEASVLADDVIVLLEKVQVNQTLTEATSTDPVVDTTSSTTEVEIEDVVLETEASTTSTTSIEFEY